MNVPTKEPRRVRPDAIGLVTSAIGGDEPALSGMLDYLTQRFDAFGCVLWECRSDDELGPENLEDGQLFVLAAHFRGGHIFALHNLPVAKSLTGQALLKQTVLSTPDILDDPGITHIDSILRKLQLGPMVTSPIHFRDGSAGAVNLYRQRGGQPFDKKDGDKLASLSRVIPVLYRSIRDKVSLDLINDVNDLLTTPLDDDQVDVTDVMRQRLHEVVRRVAKTFHSLEVSVFLENPLTAPGRCDPVATTWPEPQKQKGYVKGSNDGMTGWVIDNDKPMMIFDWASYGKEKEDYAKKYPGAEWRDPLDIVQTARKILDLGPEERLPPLSYIAAPVPVGNQVGGAIRSSAGQRGAPYYYDPTDLKLLQLVAAQIGRYWGAWLSRNRMKAEADVWQARTFEDLEHQVRGPLQQVQRRIEWLMNEYGRDNRRVAAVRGLCRKAVRAAGTIGVLPRLGADAKPLSLRYAPLSYDGLVKLLIEMADDNELLVGPERMIRFDVDRGSFNLPHLLPRIRVDQALFEQVLNNVLDNAGKYSFENTRVRIFGGLTSKGNFHVTVANTGIRIRGEDVGKCRQRGWRSDEARWVGDEGSGIGLWIVDNVMKAHSGYLEIVPTTRDGETQVKLVFPVTRT